MNENIKTLLAVAGFCVFIWTVEIIKTSSWIGGTTAITTDSSKPACPVCGQKPSLEYKDVRIVVITYKEGPLLTACIESILNSTVHQVRYEVIILNNFAGNQFPEWIMTHQNITVVHNAGRRDFSIGYLSRSWNQGLIFGFQSLQSPISGIVTTLQGDSLLAPTWWDELSVLHRRWFFIQMGIGDQFMSYTVDAVRNIGLWDERLCGIGVHEADYFLRAVLYDRDQTTLNDYPHGRVYQPLDQINVIRRVLVPTFSGQQRGTPEHKLGQSYHHVSEAVFRYKWGAVAREHWGSGLPWNQIRPFGYNFIF